jgi:hypothetical protein
VSAETMLLTIEIDLQYRPVTRVIMQASPTAKTMVCSFLAPGTKSIGERGAIAAWVHWLSLSSKVEEVLLMGMEEKWRARFNFKCKCGLSFLRNGVSKRRLGRANNRP